MTATDPRPVYAAHDPAVLRLHGAGDGSVMAYCGLCREPPPHLPRPATLSAVEEAWGRHTSDYALTQLHDPRG